MGDWKTYFFFWLQEVFFLHAQKFFNKCGMTCENEVRRSLAVLVYSKFCIQALASKFTYGGFLFLSMNKAKWVSAIPGFGWRPLHRRWIDTEHLISRKKSAQLCAASIAMKDLLKTWDFLDADKKAAAPLEGIGEKVPTLPFK